MGPAGSGKSSIVTRYAFAAAEQGENVAMFIFDEGIETLLGRSAALGMNLKPHVEKGRISIQQIDPAELSQGEFAHAVRAAVEKARAGMVVIDSLNGYLHAMSQEQMVVIQLHEVLSYLRQQGTITVMVLAQHGLMGTAIATPVDVSYLADTVLLTRYFEAGGRIRKAMSVMKKRSGRHEDTIRELTLGVEGIGVGPPLDRFRGVLTGVPVLEGALTAAGALLGKPSG
jgi:circadian clock protein KaiC